MTQDLEPAVPSATPVAPAAADESWDWEAFRVGGRLYLYCYLRETIRIPVTCDPLDPMFHSSLGAGS